MARQADALRSMSPEKTGSYLTAYRAQVTRSRKRRRRLIAVLIAIPVILAAVLGYVVLTTDHLTGFRVSAPAGDCWSGSVATYQSVKNVTGCGSNDLSLPLACPSNFYTSMGLVIRKVSAGTWTLSATAYTDGQRGLSGSIAAEYGGFAMSEPCGG